MKNPYQPPKTNPKREYDRWLETVNRREETDWAGFIFVVIIFATTPDKFFRRDI